MSRDFELNDNILEQANWLGLNAGILKGVVQQKPDKNGNVRTRDQVENSFRFNLQMLGQYIREAKQAALTQAVAEENQQLRLALMDRDKELSELKSKAKKK